MLSFRGKSGRRGAEDEAPEAPIPSWVTTFGASGDPRRLEPPVVAPVSPAPAPDPTAPAVAPWTPSTAVPARPPLALVPALEPVALAPAAPAPEPVVAAPEPVASAPAAPALESPAKPQPRPVAVPTSAGHDVRPPAAPDITPRALLARDVLKRKAMVSARVVAEQVRCVECGICSYNCPLGIDVRGHVRKGLPISDRACLTCGECVARCPRGTLRFEESSVFTASFPAEALWP